MIHFHSQTDEIQTLCVKIIIILKIIILLIIILTNWQCKHLIHRWAVMSPLHLYAWEIWLLAAPMSSESWLRISMDYPNPLWPLTPSRRNIRLVSVLQLFCYFQIVSFAWPKFEKGNQVCTVAHIWINYMSMSQISVVNKRK